MVDVRKLAPVLLLSALVLAGCTGGEGGGDEPGGDAPPVVATETTGGIRGVVVDDRITPIEGALVEVLTTDRSMTTGADGTFVFSGLEPGAYTVKASHGLYSTAQQVTEVVAGDGNPDSVKIQLLRTVFAEPYMTVEKFDGFIVCSAGHPEVGYSEECGEGAGVPGVGRVGGQGNNNVQYDFTVDTDLVKTIQVEMNWEPSAQTAASGQLLTYVSTGWVCDPLCGGDTFVRGGSASPMLLRADIHVNADGDRILSNTTACNNCDEVKNITPDVVISTFTWANPDTYDPATGQVPLGSVMLNQAYSLYVIKSYALPLPEGWSFVNEDPDPFQ